MRSPSPVVCAGLLAAILLLSLFPGAIPKSGDQCAQCHGSYHQYLDIVEGSADNRIPFSIGSSSTENVTVAVKNECNARKYNTITSVSASLFSVKGLFRVLDNPVPLGSLAPGQVKQATWQIAAVAPGMDMLRITVQGMNTHENCRFNDTYSPEPFITVGAPAVNAPPSMTIDRPVPGFRATGGSELVVGWTVTDEDRASCTVDLYYSTDGFATGNMSIATGLRTDQPFIWTLPTIDCGTVELWGVVTDSAGQKNETAMAGPFTIDSTPPSVLSVEPADRGINVTDLAVIVVRFSEPVDADSARSAFAMNPDPGGGQWSWDPGGDTAMVAHSPFSVSTEYFCRFSPGVLDRSVPGNRDGTGHSWSFSTSAAFIPTPSVGVFSPWDDDRFYQGQNITVKWTATGGVGPLGINVSLSARGPAGPFSPVASLLPNNGVFSFVAPGIVSEMCVLAVSAVDANGTESRTLGGIFSIAAPLVLDAQLPADDASLVANRTLVVSWNASGGHKAVSVRIRFQADTGAPSLSVASNLPRSGSYRWTVPVADTPSARLIVNATDGWGVSVEDASGRFAITSLDPGLPPPPVPPPDRPPVVAFNIRENAVVAGKNITFDASASFDPERAPMRFVWDFGDGGVPRNTTDPVVSHRFAGKGHYMVRLTVSDDQGESTQAMVLEVGGPATAAAGRHFQGALAWMGAVVIVLGSAGVALAAFPRREGG